MHYGRRSHEVIPRHVACTTLVAVILLSVSGCSRQFWRRQADRDTYNATVEKLNHPHWQVPRFHLAPDHRSRFFDPWDPDKGPLPPDDPAAHEFMHQVNGRRGYKNWHKMGRSLSIENPQWLEPFGIAVQGADPVIGHSRVELRDVTLPQAVELSYIHSREYQTAIEDLYLSALALTLERFKLGVRYLGVNGTEPGASLFSTTRRNGNTTGTLNSSFGISQVLPTGGQIAVELANSTLWLFGSPGSSSASSLSYSLTQPLMFRAGRKIALEPLTQAERNVLYQARILARFRQSLFTATAQSYLALLQQRQNILNSENNIRQLNERLVAQQAQDEYQSNLLHYALANFPEGVTIPESLSPNLSHTDGNLFWNGPMTLEQRDALLELSDDPFYQIAAQQIVNWKFGKTKGLSALQLINTFNTAQSQLENFRRQFGDLQDSFKIALGLPTNVTLEVEEKTLLRQFELISQALILADARFREVQLKFGPALLPERTDDGIPDIKLTDVQSYLRELIEARDQLYGDGIEQLQRDFNQVDEVLELTGSDWQQITAGKRYFLTAEERKRVVTDIEEDRREYRAQERQIALHTNTLRELSWILEISDEQSLLNSLDRDGSGDISIAEIPGGLRRSIQTIRNAVDATESSIDDNEILAAVSATANNLREDLMSAAQSLQRVQATVRVECIALNKFHLGNPAESPDVEEVVQIGLENRHDLMNARARVMDRRRAVEVAANQLEAALDVRIEGTAGLSQQNQGTSNYRAGLNFTTPLDQVIERNAYNTAIVAYQRERRAYMLLEDQVKQQIRQSWRQLQTQERRIEFDRQTVRSAAKQYENAVILSTGTQQTNALNLLQALNAVLSAQNALVADWVTYETNRLNIFRDMGIMEVNPGGLWTDRFYLQMDTASGTATSSSAMSPAVIEVETPADPVPTTTESLPIPDLPVPEAPAQKVQ
ncbi:MAG: TolC family protein [Planctomyces sp.]